MEQKQRNNPGQKPRSAKRRRRRRASGAPVASRRADHDRSSATGATVAGPATVSPAVPAPAGSAQAVDAGDGETAVGAPSPAVPASVPVPPAAVDGSGAADTACPVCSTTVHDLYTAIAYGDGMTPAHFDCVLSELGEREELGSGERLCYLGGGSFGIVQMRPPRRKRNGNGGGLFIRKRIDFEQGDTAPGWRRELRLTFRPPSTAAPGGPEDAPCR